MRRQAGVLVAGLVVQTTLQNMLTRLRRQVCVENELSGVHAELLARSHREGIVRARRKVGLTRRRAVIDVNVANGSKDLWPNMTRSEIAALLHAWKKSNGMIGDGVRRARYSRAPAPSRDQPGPDAFARSDYRSE